MAERRTSRSPDPADPKGLIAESYRIEGIGAAECRSIFLDWALGLGHGADTRACAGHLLERYGTAAPDHPMTAILRDSVGRPAAPARRGGAAGRRRVGS